MLVVPEIGDAITGDAAVHQVTPTCDTAAL